MERSAIQVPAKRGKSIRGIAEEVGRRPTTVARVLREPVDRTPTMRRRRLQVDPYREQIGRWIAERLSTVRMLEVAPAHPEPPSTGSRSQFGEMVCRIRRRQEQQAQQVAVPIRFAGLPAEYLQVDWGEVRRFPFLPQVPAPRYFLAGRLKYWRGVWVRCTTDRRRETLFRGLVDYLAVLGWVPWVLVVDHMKTVTSGRDSAGQAVWTPALRQLAGELGFHPQACDPGAANQKGSVESLLKWVKGSFLSGRAFTDDADLAAQPADWVRQANERPSAATARFITAQTLAGHLVRTTAALGRQRLLTPLLTCDVLVLDELGYLPTVPAFGPSLYEIVALHHPDSVVSCSSHRM